MKTEISDVINRKKKHVQNVLIDFMIKKEAQIFHIFINIRHDFYFIDMFL
jgi:hypothetical protein